MPGPITTDADHVDLQDQDNLEYLQRRIPVGRIGDARWAEIRATEDEGN